jgi:hypothetical protein
MRKNSLEQIAKILPEGLDENLLEQIAELVHTKITEEVSAKTNELTIKVKAFLRGQIDSLKEHAVKELELENETFRNAQLFESVRAVFATELTSDDEVNAVNLLSLEQENMGRKVEVIAGELDKSLKENVQLKKLLKVISDKNERLEEQTKSHVRQLKESKASENMELSETARIVSKETFQRQGKKLEERRVSAPPSDGNEFLTEGVLGLMR